MAKLSFLIVFMMLCASVSFAGNHKFDVDSTDGTTHERVIATEHKIGDHDYHKFGALTVEKKGDRYFITFPFFVFTGAPTNDFAIDEDAIPAGTPIFLRLSNRKIIQAKTSKRTNFSSHFLWRYDAVVIIHNKNYETTLDGYPTHLKTFSWHDDSKSKQVLAQNTGKYDDLFGINWLATFEFTADDMAALSHSRIESAHSRRGNQIIFVPIKKNQAKRIEKSIATLMKA